MKKFLVFLFVLAVLIGGVALGKNAIIKTSVERGVELVTGLKLNMGSLNVGILKPIVDIKNLTLLNPPSYSDRTMIDIPEIYVDYDLKSILGGKIHLPEVRLALKEFVVVKNAQGELNLDALKTVQAQKEEKAPSQKAPGKAPQIQIDLLKLSVGKVIYKDYSRGATPAVKEFNVNLNESYTNVGDPNALLNLIIVKTLMNTSIAGLANFDLGGLQGSVGGILSDAQKMASPEAVTGAVKGAQDALKGLVKNPFGSGK